MKSVPVELAGRGVGHDARPKATRPPGKSPGGGGSAANDDYPGSAEASASDRAAQWPRPLPARMWEVMCSAHSPTPGNVPVFNDGIHGIPTK